MPTALQMAADDTALSAAVTRSRKLLHKRAVIAAAASAVPVPGLDWAVDAAMLSRLIPEINREFGLSPQQLDRRGARWEATRSAGSSCVRCPRE